MLHMIYQVEEIKENFHNFGNGRSGQITSRKISNMANFVAEVHVISDSVHQKEFKTTEDLIAYFAVLINGVNLSYLDMTRPRIKFMLVGITRSLDDVFSVHMEPAVLEMQKTLDGLYKYYVQGRVPGKPDIVHLITGQDLALYDKGTVDKDFAGLAMTGPPCTKKAVALSEDVPTAYRGVNMMAHELGHVLGSPHDKTSRCPWSEGFLMSYEDGGTKKFRLSECSEEKIRASLKYMPHRCPKILAHTDYMSRYKYVPGQKVSELDYCRKLLKKHTSRTDIFYTKPEDLKNKCKMKCCFLTEPNIEDCLVALILDGMACGKGKVSPPERYTALVDLQPGSGER
ncbi:venom metalloproteinase antarease-like TserMP_B [Dermacentor variabilis]|uniref:venom metalloproteinase antarease-like TserMP_B n=1 Tax=Dermacentor variabilis TaxID=34621 RepID=UPI003F5B396C